jgi:chorismate synthase
LVQVSGRVEKIRNSCGAVIEVVADGVPPGWGAPIYGKLDQDWPPP